MFINRDIRFKIKTKIKIIIFWIISQNFDQIITMWHLGYGDTPPGKYLLKNIHVLKSGPHDFQVSSKAAMSDEHIYNYLMKQFTWKRRLWNVMKMETISSIKYICHNKQLKNLYKFILWLWISISKLLPSTFIKL